MGYRQWQHGITTLNDVRECAATCQSCSWYVTVVLNRSNETKEFYRAAKDHAELTRHVVELVHTHKVVYAPHHA